MFCSLFVFVKSFCECLVIRNARFAEIAAEIIIISHPSQSPKIVPAKIVKITAEIPSRVPIM